MGEATSNVIIFTNGGYVRHLSGLELTKKGLTKDWLFRCHLCTGQKGQNQTAKKQTSRKQYFQKNNEHTLPSPSCIGVQNTCAS